MNRPSAFGLGAILIILLALAFRLAMNVDPVGPDSLVYAQHAHELAEGELDLSGTDQYLHRMTVYAPTSLLYTWFGPNQLTTALWPILASLFQIGIAMLVARKLFGPRVALIAGSLLACLPLDVTCSVRLMPDIVQASLTTGAVGLWVLASGGESRGRLAAVIASGACLTLAAATRPYALLAGIPMLLWSYWSRPSIRVLLLWAAGFAAPILAICASYWLITGDPLYRWHVVVLNYGQLLAPETRSSAYYLRSSLAPRGEIGAIGPLFLSALAFSIFERRRAWWFLLAWAGCFLIFLSFGSMSLSEFKPIYKRLRFLTPVLPVAAILCAAWIEALPRYLRGIPRLAPVAVAGALLVAPLHAAWLLPKLREPRAQERGEQRAVAEILRENEADMIYFDHWRSALRYQYLLDFRLEPSVYVGSLDVERMRPNSDSSRNYGYLGWFEHSEELPRSLVVLDEDLLTAWRESDGSFFGQASPPGFAIQPPESWQQIFASGPYRVYQTGPAGQ